MHVFVSMTLFHSPREFLFKWFIVLTRTWNSIPKKTKKSTNYNSNRTLNQDYWLWTMNHLGRINFIDICLLLNGVYSHKKNWESLNAKPKYARNSCKGFYWPLSSLKQTNTMKGFQWMIPLDWLYSTDYRLYYYSCVVHLLSDYNAK